MTRAMRSLLVILALGLGCGFASAAPLSDADKEALLERLDALKKEALERTDARFRAGVGAYSSAMSSDDAALELYLKCIEKVDFDDQKRKAGEFREWKRKEDEKLSKPSLKLALRHQLHWLMLTLQAASENADRPQLAIAAQSATDAVFRDLVILKEQQAILKQSVLGSVFAKAYEINGVKVDKWPFSPVDIPGIYEQLVFPPLRNSGNVTALRDAWVKRIQQEGALIEYWSPSPKDQGRDKDKEGRIGMAESVRPPEFDKFINDTLPVMQWQMEMDLFKAGDQASAALRMLAHIEKNVANQHAKEWSDQFRALLTTPKTAAKAEEGAAK